MRQFIINTMADREKDLNLVLIDAFKIFCFGLFLMVLGMCIIHHVLNILDIDNNIKYSQNAAKTKKQT
jgi:hypothetical protein